MDKNKAYVSDFDHSGFTVKYIKSMDFDLSSSDNGVKISWSDIEGAASYRVYKKIEGSTWKTAASTKDTVWFDAKVESGSAYSYYVRGIDENGNFVTGYLPTGKQITCVETETPSEPATEQPEPT